MNKSKRKSENIYLETNENGNKTFQKIWDAAKAAEREVHSYIGLPQ